MEQASAAAVAPPSKGERGGRFAWGGVLLFFIGLFSIPVRVQNAMPARVSDIPSLPFGLRAAFSTVAIIAGLSFLIGGIRLRKKMESGRRMLLVGTRIVAGYIVAYPVVVAITMLTSEGSPTLRLIATGGGFLGATIWGYATYRLYRYVETLRPGFADEQVSGAA